MTKKVGRFGIKNSRVRCAGVGRERSDESEAEPVFSEKRRNRWVALQRTGGNVSSLEELNPGHELNRGVGQICLNEILRLTDRNCRSRGKWQAQQRP